MRFRAVVPELVGREPELEQVRSWAHGLSTGPSALVIRGEAGIGKTTIWQVATAEAASAEATVLVSRPVESELPLGHAGLGDLFGRVAASVLDRLPELQSRALKSALSLDSDGEITEPLLVGRATVALLRSLAESAPVVIAIDDVQWLDRPSARALAFAARRLEGAPVGLVLSVRDGHEEPLQIASALGDRIRTMSLTGLSLGGLGHLLRVRIDPELSRRTLLRIHEQSAGNPFYAMELARARDDRLPPSLTEIVGRRLEEGDAASQRVIEQLAVLGPAPVSAIADAAGLDSAILHGLLIEQHEEVRFAHPLLAAGAYQRIPPGRRRALHREAASTVATLEERARHLALAATGPDPTSAAILDEAAVAARRRGAPETAAELADHAARLTPDEDPAARDRRLMDRADYLALAADEAAARRIVDDLLRRGVRGTTRVRALVWRALTETTPDAAVADLEAAVAEPHDDGLLAVRTLAQLAWQRGAWQGAVEPAIREALEAVAKADQLGDPSALVTALTAAGLVSSIAGRAGAAEHFRRALAITELNPRAASDHSLRLAYAHERWWRGDFMTAQALLDEEWRLAAEHGDDGQKMRLTIFRAVLASYRGHWNECESLLDDALGAARDYWRVLALVHRAILRGRRGDRRALADAAEIHASAAGIADAVLGPAADFAVGWIDIAEGRTAEAAERMSRLPEVSDSHGSRGPEFAAVIPETVAVLVEADRLADAGALLRQLERRMVQLEPWSAAAADLCRGLLELGAGQADEAVGHVRAAAERFEGMGSPWEAGQARLAEGNALRRLGRRREAARALEIAIVIFAGLGAHPALRRAEDALRRARPRRREAGQLTAAENRVAALVANGRTNREVAATLFTTVATVEAHLTRIYSKLGIRSRTDLANRLRGEAGPLRPHDSGEPE